MWSSSRTNSCRVGAWYFATCSPARILAPAWRDLLQVYRRMEARGEIRGGRFVLGFLGEQFTRPEALDLLRHLRRTAKTGEALEIAPADPLNLSGIVLPGPRTGALTQEPLRLLDGVLQAVGF